MIKPCGSGTSTFGCPAQLESLHGCPCLSLIASSTARSGHRGCSVAQLLHCSLYICKEIFRSPSPSLFLFLCLSVSLCLFLSQCAITSLELCQPHRVGNKVSKESSLDGARMFLERSTTVCLDFELVQLS